MGEGIVEIGTARDLLDALTVGVIEIALFNRAAILDFFEPVLHIPG